MDLTIENYSNHQAFGARLNRETVRAIRRGINAEYRESLGFSKKIARMVREERNEKFKRIKKQVAELDKGTISVYNQLGLNPRATKMAFASKNRYVSFDLPEEIQNEIKIVNKSNIFRDKYVVSEFPSRRLSWLLNFVENVIS